MNHPPSQPLPIDPVLPSIVSAFRARGAVVIEAPPGAGKTTRVPRALLESGLPGGGELIVVEPRRLAARMAARRVAAELGEEVGGTVGYQVRHEDMSGPATRLKFVTEGVLVRRLADDPALSGVGAVVFDEHHERHLDADLSLALVRRARENSRSDLRVAVMSATMDAAPVAAWLDAPVVRSEGRCFDVALEHLSPAEAADAKTRIENRVATAVRRVLREGPDGHVLVFLPGMSEIRRAIDACAPFAGAAGVDLLPLHGDLSPEEQDRAVLPASRRKVVFATNVAETSVTIDGVTSVIDSGLARVAFHSPWSGLPRLELRKISRASAAQRAGRAGRTAPGLALRLYTAFDHDMRPSYDAPEVAREDFSGTLLLLSTIGALDLEWLDAPPESALEAAGALLRRLGAVDAKGDATALGREMARFPLHPRISRFVLEAHARGAGGAGAIVAALMSEGDVRRGDGGRSGRGGAPAGRSDLVELWERYSDAEREGFRGDSLRALGLDRRGLSNVSRTVRQIGSYLPGSRALSPTRSGDVEEALEAAALSAYPDRLGRRRDAGGSEIALAAGGSARMAPESVVRTAPLLLAVDVEERRASAPGLPSRIERNATTIRLASATTAEMLFDLFPERLKWDESVEWNAEAGRVDAWETLSYEGFVIETSRMGRVDPVKAAAMLATEAGKKGIRHFADEGAIDRLLARIAFVSGTVPGAGLVLPTEAALEDALSAACEGLRSFSELRKADLAAAVAAMLPPDRRATLDRMAPERVTLEGGRTIRVTYEAGKTPFVESRLQDFFGSRTGPSVAGGRVPVVIHLLAPSMRPVQLTSDLAGFWERHYPAIRKELMRRYPKHAWPENPLEAAPPRRGR